MSAGPQNQACRHQPGRQGASNPPAAATIARPTRPPTTLAAYPHASVSSQTGDLTGQKRNTSPQMAKTHSFEVTGPGRRGRAWPALCARHPQRHQRLVLRPGAAATRTLVRPRPAANPAAPQPGAPTGVGQGPGREPAGTDLAPGTLAR